MIFESSASQQRLVDGDLGLRAASVRFSRRETSTFPRCSRRAKARRTTGSSAASVSRVLIVRSRNRAFTLRTATSAVRCGPTAPLARPNPGHAPDRHEAAADAGAAWSSANCCMSCSLR